MTPAQAADIQGSLDSAVKSIADQYTTEAEVKHRLEFLLWRVLEGRCSDFFSDNGQPRVSTHKFINQFTGQPDEYTRETYTTSPQWSNPLTLKGEDGETHTYIHCRYKGPQS